MAPGRARWRRSVASPASPHLPHRLRRLFRIESLGVERPPPLQHLLMPLVEGIGDGCHVIDVAPRPPAVLGRASSFALDAHRVFRLRVVGYEPLELDLMPPAVAEVVLVNPPWLPA